MVAGRIVGSVERKIRTAIGATTQPRWAAQHRRRGSMTDTREMLDASPAAIPLGVSETTRAIDACLNCLQTCTSCADANIVEEDVDELRTCIALCLTCANVCDLMAQALSRPAQWDDVATFRLLQACVRTCTLSAEECARHADHHRHCAVCETACRASLQACTKLLEAAAFAELQKPCA
jgi:hypothetical protein